MLPLVLIVDDEEEILDFLERILSKKYNVLRAPNGKMALTLLENEPVQLIISDVMMPEMDGFEFCKLVKSDFKHSHIPIILLTAKNTIQSKVEGLELGADAYIEKPFSKEHLLAQMASLITNRNMIREYFASSPLVHINSIAHTKADEQFLATLNEKILDALLDTELDVGSLSKMMNMSRVTLYRKIKAISGMPPVKFIGLVRLKKATELLTEGHYKIYEICAIAGYSTPSNFTRSFLKQFNMTPTEYMQTRQSKS